MSLPADLKLRTVRGTYVTPAGNPVVGTVSFRQSMFIADKLNGVGITAGDVAVTLVNGAFTVNLLTADSVDETVTEWTYVVTEQFPGGRAPFDFRLTYDDGSPVDLPLVGPSTSSGGVYVPPAAFTGYIRS